MNKTTIALVLASASMMPMVASAGLVSCGGPDQDPCGICDLFKLINVAIETVLKVFIPLAATLVVVYAGFKMMINQGDPDIAKKCKSIMLAVAIGLVVVFASYAIVGMILNSMGVVEYGGSGTVNPLDWEPKCDDSAN